MPQPKDHAVLLVQLHAAESIRHCGSANELWNLMNGAMSLPGGPLPAGLRVPMRYVLALHERAGNVFRSLPTDAVWRVLEHVRMLMVADSLGLPANCHPRPTEFPVADGAVVQGLLSLIRNVLASLRRGS